MARNPVVTRKTNVLAGARPPLPGQDHHREASLRATLVEHFAPVGPVEMIWVGDIAWCTAVIEVIRAQITGFQLLKVKQAYKAIKDGDTLNKQGDLAPDYSTFSVEDREQLDTVAAHNFVAPWQKSWLDSAPFSVLLGAMPRSDVIHFRWLQESLHNEMRERDRIINEFDRRRRQAMRDAIELAEAERRAAADGAVLTEAVQDPALTESLDTDDTPDGAVGAAEEDAPFCDAEPSDSDDLAEREVCPEGLCIVADDGNTDVKRDDAVMAVPPLQDPAV